MSSSRREARSAGVVYPFSPQISSVIADGDDIVVIGRELGRIRGTGTAYDIQFAQHFKFREGKLASLQIIAANSV